MKKETDTEKLLYREAMQVTEMIISGDGYTYPVCPRCDNSFEYEYQFYCDRCGQKLNWKGYKRAKPKLIFLN